MDKIVYLANRANDAILKSAVDLDDFDLFGPMQDTEMSGIDFETTEVFGESQSLKGKIVKIKFLISIFLVLHFFFLSEDSDDDDSDEQEDSLSQTVYMSWYHHSDPLEHEYALTVWALMLVPEIGNDVLERLTGDMGKN